jgi:c-di-GMP-binding flagellar brake protein YcgR
MSRCATLESQTIKPVLSWAASKETPLSVSVQSGGLWFNLRSQIRQFDEAEGLLEILYPISPTGSACPEYVPGMSLGITFRRGHKKCAFVGTVLLRRRAAAADGAPIDVLILRMPDKMRELQRRSYQRITLPVERFVPVKLWQGGAPLDGETSWPLCAGRLGNISLGGLLVDLRREHNPRLSVGETVGVEIVTTPGQPPILADGQYRHCAMNGPDRLGLGVQFLGLEQELAGRSTLPQIAEFVSDMRKFAIRIDD